MKAVIQRVSHAACHALGEVTGECKEGLLILLGVAQGDTEEDARLLAEKISKLRIFSDENDKLNLSVMDVGGSILAISNFTLMANYAHGNRPDYMAAEKPERANRLYEHFMKLLSDKGIPVGKGAFGEHMEIVTSLHGPITIVMESEVLRKKGK